MAIDDPQEFPSFRLTSAEATELMRALRLMASQMATNDPARVGLVEISEIVGRAMDRENREDEE